MPITGTDIATKVGVVAQARADLAEANATSDSARAGLSSAQAALDAATSDLATTLETFIVEQQEAL